MKNKWVRGESWDSSAEFLRIPKALKEQLPDGSAPLMGEFLDTETGLIHTGDIGYWAWVDEYGEYDFYEDGMTQLSEYFYLSHCCGCHRAQYCGVDDCKGCPDYRFQLRKVFNPKAPVIVLIKNEIFTPSNSR